MLMCPPWSHRIVPQVMRHGSQKMLAEIGHLLGISYHCRTDQTFPSRLFRTAALSLGYMAPDVAWVGGQIFLAETCRNTEPLQNVWTCLEGSPAAFPGSKPGFLMIFVNLLVWQLTRNKRRIVLDIE